MLQIVIEKINWDEEARRKDCFPCSPQSQRRLSAGPGLADPQRCACWARHSGSWGAQSCGSDAGKNRQARPRDQKQRQRGSHSGRGPGLGMEKTGHYYYTTNTSNIIRYFYMVCIAPAYIISLNLLSLPKKLLFTSQR